MADFEENAIEWLTGQKRATVTATQKRLANRLQKFAKDFPDAVDIIVNKDGSVCAHVPVNWVKISPQKSRSMTEEQREAAAERLRLAREKKNEEKNKTITV